MNENENDFPAGSGSVLENDRGAFGFKKDTTHRDILATGSYDVKQFVGSELGNMKKTVRTYIDDIDSVLINIQAAKPGEYGAAIFGSEQVAKIADYVKRSIDEIQKVTNYFDSFNLALDKVAENYKIQNVNVRVSDVVSADAAIGDEDLTGVQGFGGSSTTANSAPGGGGGNSGGVSSGDIQ